jgi:hypothetical protein
MSRSITDPIEEPQSQDQAEERTEEERVLRELIISHNMLHDRLVRLEAIVDKLAGPTHVK